MSQEVRKPWDPVPLALVVGALLLAVMIWVLIPRPVDPERVLGHRPQAPQAAPTKTPEKPATPGGTLPIVQIDTTMGTIKARLFSDKAPKTVENFTDLVGQGFYDGIIFHRVIPGFMIQTGDPKGEGTGGRTDKGLPEKFLADEFHPELRHSKAGILSMANAGPDTGDTQFFITCAPTPHLDDRHAVFGEVVEGLDVVQKIAAVPTIDSGERGEKSRPVDPPKMTKVRLVEPVASK